MNIYTPMFRNIHNSQIWKQPKCPPVDECVKKMLHTIHSHEKQEILPTAATWMDLENILLSEMSQPAKRRLGKKK